MTHTTVNRKTTLQLLVALEDANDTIGSTVEQIVGKLPPSERRAAQKILEPIRQGPSEVRSTLETRLLELLEEERQQVHQAATATIAVDPVMHNPPPDGWEHVERTPSGRVPVAHPWNPKPPSTIEDDWEDPFTEEACDIDDDA